MEEEALEPMMVAIIMPFAKMCLVGVEPVML
jgi:hypothetical protein